MKKKTRLALSLLALSLPILLATTRAEEKKQQEKALPAEAEIDLQKQIKMALTKSGLDAKTIQQISESLDGDSSGSVSVQTTLIGPDGEVTSSHKSTSQIPDLNKLISEATQMAKKAAETSLPSEDGKTKTTVTTSVSGKVIVVGPDGKTETHELGDEDQNAAFQKAISEALSNIDLESLSNRSTGTGSQVIEFGPAVIESSAIEERLTALENEIKEQKKLLEKILKKLD